MIALENARAGLVGRCGECGQKFRVPDETPPYEDSPLTPTTTKTKPLPGEPSAPQHELVSERRESAARPSRHERQDNDPRRRESDDEERPRSGRGRDDDDDVKLARRGTANREPDDDEVAAVDDEKAERDSPPVARARKKKKNRPAPQSAGFASVVLVALAAAGLWGLLLVAALFFKPAMWILIIGGVITAIAGRAMFAAVVRQDSPGQRLACMFIPFYSAFYMFTHLGRTLVPFLVAFYGYVLVISGGILWFYHDSREPLAVDGEQPGIARQAPGPKLPPTKLVLNLAGKEENFHSDGLSPVPGNRFVIQGDMITIWGTLPNGFAGKWDQLVGQPLPVQPGSNGDDSEIQRPGGGVIKITGGTVTIEKAESIGGKWFLRGRLELKYGGADADVAIVGKFELPVYSENDEEE